MSPAEPVVVADQLTKKYGDFVALDGLSLTVGRGQILGFIGPNGAGKTTMIKILVGLARPTSGSASVGGADCVRDARQIKRLVGYMPDTFGSYDNMRVREYLDFFGAAFGIPRRQRVNRIDEVLDVTGSAYMRDKYVESLSHGMRQRVGVARTLLHDPPVLILDEPANGLDPQARIEMRELLSRLAESGKSLLVTSHILPELSRVCHRVAIITKGKLRACGTLDEIARSVRQVRTVEVLLTRPDQVAAAAAVIRKVIEPGMAVTESAAESTVRFQTGKREDELAQVLTALVSAPLTVVQFREVQTDLEDAFMTVARQAEEEASAAPSRVAGTAVAAL
ncbi:MAG: ABC transporter ATP-binding protein [Gemmataceae bacterium]